MSNCSRKTIKEMEQGMESKAYRRKESGMEGFIG
jgi:hypothetical protein